jgi:light-regulated signal transduction histidine kinase (bacteriophytochrome)
MAPDRRAPQSEDQAAPTRGDDFTRAILNILEDFGSERDRFSDTQKAILNILDDFSAEKLRLEQTERAVMNILEDFDDEKTKVELANRELLSEIGERAQAEAALRRKTTELARSNSELEQFAYVASHDLQEPLRMVSSYVQLFEKKYRNQVDEKADKYIAYAVEGAKRMQTLIAGLLEYSRVGREEVPPQSVSLEKVLDLALLNLSPALQDNQALISRDPLPTVMGHPALLAQVFQNLLANAEKFRRPGVRPEVHVSAVRESGEWVVGVQDNGIGIDAEFFDRIFVIFQRLHTRAEYPGTGIGLSICKKVIERHGGRIWVESQPGQGAHFRFSLPSIRSET